MKPSDIAKYEGRLLPLAIAVYILYAQLGDLKKSFDDFQYSMHQRLTRIELSLSRTDYTREHKRRKSDDSGIVSQQDAFQL